MNPKPIVTLLIANYNYAHYIESAVQSAINQDYDGPIQVCVINDGSTDDSWSVLRSMCRADDAPIITQNISENRTLIAINRENGGASIARNTGIDYTWDSTDIYGILDADDYYYENSFKTVNNYFNKYDIDFLFGTVQKYKIMHGFMKTLKLAAISRIFKD